MSNAYFLNTYFSLFDENVENIAQSVIPKKGKFEVEDFKEW